jgi:DNA-directed RNA polymerase subunit RPC12/RpoP
MKCSKCDYTLDSKDIFCPNCGSKVVQKKETTKVVAEKVEKETEEKVDQSGQNSWAWGILGYFVPLVGLILFIVWNDTRKKDAKAAGIGALIKTILSFVILVFYIVFIILLGASSYNYYAY